MDGNDTNSVRIESDEIFDFVGAKPKTYDAVVLSGGGNKGLLTLGALHYEFERGVYDMEKCNIYAGTSIGSVICLLLICGYTPMAIFTEIYGTVHFFGVGDYHNIWDVVKFMGLLPIREFVEKIETLVKAKLGDIPTLRELQKRTGKTLVVAVSNVTKMRCEYYTPETRPHLGCVNAVKLSSNLPLVFQRIKYDDCYIVDGGLMDNFPLKYIDDGKMKILGIVIMGTDFSLPDSQVVGYFGRLIVMPTNANTELRCDLARSNTKLVRIIWNDAPILQFTMPSETKMNMFLHGYNFAEREDNIRYIHVAGWPQLRDVIGIPRDGNSDDETPSSPTPTPLGVPLDDWNVTGWGSSSDEDIDTSTARID